MRLLCSVLVAVITASIGVAAAGADERRLDAPTSMAVLGTCVAPPRGLVSWWRGEDNATDSAGSNDGALHNGAGFSPGKVGQGFRFDGVDDFVQASTTDMPIGNEDRTLQAWIHIDAFNPGGESFFAAYGQFGDFNRVYMIGAHPDDRLFFSQWGKDVLGPRLQTKQWYHVTVSNRGDDITLYLNGTPTMTGALFFDTPVGSLFQIGQIPQDDYRRLKGMVDEVAVFGRALSDTEVKAIYDAGSAGMCDSSAARRISTSAHPADKWRTIAPVRNLEGLPIFPVGLDWEAANIGWNTSLTFDDSSAAGWHVPVRRDVTPFGGTSTNNIWSDGDDGVGNTPSYFRKTFVLSELPTSAHFGSDLLDDYGDVIDDDVQIYINGHLAFDDQDGVATFIPVTDVTRFLRRGLNLVAVKAHDSFGGNEHFSLNLVWSTDQLGLRITTPNTPSGWGINTRQRLAWTYEGDAPQFQIDISRDAGDTWDFLSVVPNRVGGSQNFYWTVTGSSTPNARLRVTAIGDGEATDVNDADVSIAPASIEILRPSGRMSVAFGRPLSIFLRHNLGARKLIAIDVSNDGGATWRRVVSGTRTNGSTTSSSWVVDILPTTRGRLRIQAQDASGASAVSPLFTVVARQRPLEVIGGSVEIGHTFEGNVTFSIRSPEVTIEGEAHGDAGGLGIIGPRCPQPCPIISGFSRGGLSSKVGFIPMPQGSSDELLSGDLFFRTPAAVFFCGPPDGFCVGSAPFTFTGVVSRHDESGQLLASYEFIGSGTAEALFQQDGHRLGVTYTFAANPRRRALDGSGASAMSEVFAVSAPE